jgi:hypothetical protein
MADRLDEERLEVLRSWAAGLATDSREELRAAGKAITILIDEIELLYVDLWHAREAPSAPGESSGQARDEAKPPSTQGLAMTLQRRLDA